MIPYVSLVTGFAILIKSADLLVKGASSVARRIKVSELAIGLTVVAFGTSTPELFVNLVASFQGNTAIAIGNILGSNVANILLILGISTLIKPLPFKPTSNLDIAVVVFSSLLLFGFMFTGKKRSLDRWEGIVFVFLYGAYVAVIADLFPISKPGLQPIKCLNHIFETRCMLVRNIWPGETQCEHLDSPKIQQQRGIRHGWPYLTVQA